MCRGEWLVMPTSGLMFVALIRQVPFPNSLLHSHRDAAEGIEEAGWSSAVGRWLNSCVHVSTGNVSRMLAFGWDVHNCGVGRWVDSRAMLM